ncbi:MAG: POTRA domain-containing protein, partial [Tangfeifania sp.]
MRHKQVLVIIIYFLSCFLSLHIVQAQENFEVRQINFKGNKTLEKDFLLERMALKEVSWLEKVLTNEEPFLYNEELVTLDIERLIRIYQSEGFLQV